MMILAKTVLHSMICDAVCGVLCVAAMVRFMALIRGAVHRVHNWCSPEFMTTARGGLAHELRVIHHLRWFY